MMNMMGQGMGAYGTGMGASSMSLPQLLASMQAMGGPMGGSGSTPMANYIGAGKGATMMPNAMAPVGQPANLNPAGGSGMDIQALLQMLAKQNGGQQTPQAPGQQMAPGINNPGLDSLLRRFGFFGGITGGAET